MFGVLGKWSVKERLNAESAGDWSVDSNNEVTTAIPKTDKDDIDQSTSTKGPRQNVITIVA